MCKWLDRGIIGFWLEGQTQFRLLVLLVIGDRWLLHVNFGNEICKIVNWKLEMKFGFNLLF